jgi:hypothetical protein
MIYNRANILSLQFNAVTNLRRLTRAEFFTRLQLIRTLEPTVDKAFRISEERILREQLGDDPHGHLWHVSFHGSQFPGNNPMACSRQSLYRMMDFPPSEPTSRRLRQTAEAGLAVEATLVKAFSDAGILLSSSDPRNQTGFELPEAWLTSSVDAVIVFFDGNKPVPVEIKNRSAEVVAEMKLGRGPFPEHVSQNKVQTAFIRLYQERGWMWEDMDLATHGLIYYVSRDNPLETAEFRVDLDQEFFVAGIQKLKRWRGHFDEDLLPEDNPGKRTTQFGHPHGWRWSKQPCQWCQFKKTCQLDFRESVTQLSDSNGVNRARLVRPDYDPVAARQRVKQRWAKEQKEEKV